MYIGVFLVCWCYMADTCTLVSSSCVGATWRTHVHCCLPHVLMLHGGHVEIVVFLMCWFYMADTCKLLPSSCVGATWRTHVNCCLSRVLVLHGGHV